MEDSVYRSVLSLSDKDPQQAQKVLQNEAEINRMEIEIDDLATRLLALQQPMATDLRLLTSAIKINNDLERMGDLAVNIVERSLSLINEPLIKPLIFEIIGQFVPFFIQSLVNELDRPRPIIINDYIRCRKTT